MRLSPPKALRRLAADEHGYTIFFALMVMLVSSLLAAAAFLATNEDVSLTRSYTSQQKAYYAALAGIDEYKYQLTANPNYWLTCPSSENPVTKLAKTPVPGNSEEEYEDTTLGANGHALCTSGAQATIIETAGTASGTFRIESTGFSNGKKRSIVATFTHPGFLNYAWVSNFEVEDPSTFTPEPEHCAYYYNERKLIGEGKVLIEGKKFTKELEECPAIPFIGADEVNGPFHTNDAVSLCSEFAGSPSFGRKGHEPADVIEFDQGHYQDTLDFGCGGGLELFGKYTTGGATLYPPGTDNELLETAEAKFKGRTVIELEGATAPDTMNVTTWNFTTKKFETKTGVNVPKNGVIYVENEKTCGIKYSPFVGDKNYEENEKEPGVSCGNVYVKGTYTESLTIAAQNDVVVIGNITTTHEGEKGKPLENATLGLIANGFVRIYHPETFASSRASCSNSAVNQTTATDPRKWGSLTNPVVDAAILSTDHSWIVDNFMCGNPLGTLTVWGVIAQDWRGRVTEGQGGGGYLKNYNYDERLKTKQPPNFLSPTTTSWYVTRETQPCEGKTTTEGGRCPVL
jgi:Tfp pilus assembly protein PilX